MRGIQEDFPVADFRSPAQQFAEDPGAPSAPSGFLAEPKPRQLPLIGAMTSQTAASQDAFGATENQERAVFRSVLLFESIDIG